MNKWIIGAVVIVGVMLVYFFFPSQTHITNYPPHAGSVVAFGDSLVAGNGSTAGHDFVSLLSTMIGGQIINKGVPGDTTAKGLGRIIDVTSLHPRIVLLLLGGNDYLQRVPKNTTFTNLATIIDALQKDGAVVVLLGVRGGLLTDNFASDFKALAKEKGAVYVPNVLDGIYDNPKLKADEIHPNDAGYKIIAEKVYRVIAPYLKNE